MTSRQTKAYYFPAWNKAARALGWKPSLRGMDLAATRKLSWGLAEVNALYCRVWMTALGIAERDETDLCPDHLRRACNLIATENTGRKESSAKLTSADANRVVALFDLLANAEDVEAMARWEFPERAEKDGLVARIRTLAPYAYIAQVARDKFGFGDWETFNVPALKQLLFTITARARSHGGRVTA